MSKKKTMSADEKLNNVEELLFERAEPFTLKELEKVAQKEKGVRSMVVKEVVQSLVNDSRILSDKIGATNFYWLFPSQAYEMKKRKVDQLEGEIETMSEKKTKFEQEIVESSVGKEDCDERRALLKESQQLGAQIRELDEKLGVYKTKDPELIKKKEKDIKVCKENANIWTDNIFTLKKFFKDRGMSDADVCRGFEISEDLDYVE